MQTFFTFVLNETNFYLHFVQTFSVPPSELPEGGTVGNILLYTGLIMMATGLVITAVGLGDKGFRSVELRMLGPGIVITGVSLTAIRWSAA